MNDETQRWIEAGKAIAADPQAKIICPRCADEFLEVEDFSNPSAPDEIERVMKCPKCGAWNSLRLRRPVE
jgi:uncharacterized C2H2 Zn-finger protein